MITSNVFEPDALTLLRDVSLDFSGKKLSIAVIGFGKMGLLHSAILNLLNRETVKYIVDKSLVVRMGGKLLLKNVKSLKDTEGLLGLKENIDAIYVTTPTESHYFIMKRLLEAGFRYIFVEKPPTRDLQEFVELMDLSKNALIMVGFQKRFSLLFRHAKMLLEKRTLGELNSVNCLIRSGDILEDTKRYYRIRRGVLLDLGVHVLDLLTWFFDEELAVESAEYKSIYTSVDDYFRAVMTARGDIRIDLETTWSDPNYRLPETCIELVFERGAIKVTDDYIKITVREDNQESQIVRYKPMYYRSFPPVLLADPEYTIENMHFLSVIEKKHEPLTSFRMSYNTMRLLEQLYEVAYHG